MAREHTRRVSQKLNYVKGHLQLAAQVNDEAQLNGLLESSVFHLKGAYSAFLAELCSDAHMENLAGVTQFDSAVDVAKRCEMFTPAPLAQCVELESNKSWLAELLTWYKVSLNTQATMVAHANNRNIIAVGQSSKLNLAQLQEYYFLLQALIDGLREAMLEC